MSRDPWFFQRWAHQTQARGPVGKSVLTFLATMADKESGRCEAKQATLAQATQLSERTVRSHLRQLEEDGLIARRPQFRADRGRRGDEFLLLADGIAEWPDGQAVTVHPAAPSGGGPRKEAYLPHGTSGAAQEQPLEEQATPEGTIETRADAAVNKNTSPDLIPDGFPDELRPHARRVMEVLRETAVQRGANAVTVRGVARAVMDHPRKPLVAKALDLRAWLLDGNGQTVPCKDVTARFRRFLAGEVDLAGLERLNEDGNPASPGPGPPSKDGRTSGHGGESPRDRQLREKQEQADREGPILKQMLAEMGIGDENRDNRKGGSGDR